MPYPNEHAARQREPENFDRFIRQAPASWPAGVEAIIGFRRVGRREVGELQAIRFDASRWTVERARRWLRAGGFRLVIEPATGDDHSEGGDTDGSSRTDTSS